MILKLKWFKSIHFVCSWLICQQFEQRGGALWLVDSVDSIGSAAVVVFAVFAGAGVSSQLRFIQPFGLRNFLLDIDLFEHMTGSNLFIAGNFGWIESVFIHALLGRFSKLLNCASTAIMDDGSGSSSCLVTNLARRPIWIGFWGVQGIQLLLPAVEDPPPPPGELVYGDQ